MDLSRSKSHSDFIDLMNPTDDNGGVRKTEEILPSYDFQPIRPIGDSQSPNLDERKDWTSLEPKTSAASIRNYGSLDSIESAKVILEKDRKVYDAAIVSEIDRTMKKHADSLLHALEGVSARLSQLESRTHHIENSIDDLKVSVGNNHGSTDGKMRQLENILRDVQSGVQVLKDKQEMVEAQLQLYKLQVHKPDHQTEPQNTEMVQQSAASGSQQPYHTPPPVPTQMPSLPPPLPPQSLPPPPPQLPTQFPHNPISSAPQREPYFPQPGQTQETTPQQYQIPPTQQPKLPPPAQPHQQYQPPPHPQYSQPPPPPPQPPLHHPPPPQLHHQEETPYDPTPNYLPNLRQPPSQPPPSQQLYGPPSSIYDPPSGRPSSGYSTGYGPLPSGPSEPYPPYGGPQSQYGSPTAMKPPQQLSSQSSGGSGYPQLPTARILPQAVPMAAGPGGGSGSGGSGNRVPIDDVIDKVTNMGFPRELVRATVRRLTENGQSVDLNIVLDKLMNEGDVQPQRGWFGR